MSSQLTNIDVYIYTKNIVILFHIHDYARYWFIHSMVKPRLAGAVWSPGLS